MRLPRLTRRHLTNLAILAFILILIIVLIYIYPMLIQTIPPERSEWAYEELQISELNDLGYFGEGVTVGLVDTGIDLSHPELKHIKLIAWRDLINRELDPHCHGWDNCW
jgi:subtilisin family serine protease